MSSRTVHCGWQPERSGVRESWRQQCGCSWPPRRAGRHGCPWHCPQGRTTSEGTPSCTSCTGCTSWCWRPGMPILAQGCRGRVRPSSRGVQRRAARRDTCGRTCVVPCCNCRGCQRCGCGHTSLRGGRGSRLSPTTWSAGSPSMAGRPKGHHMGGAGCQLFLARPCRRPPTINCGGCASHLASGRKCCNKHRGCCSTTWPRGGSCREPPLPGARVDGGLRARPFFADRVDMVLQLQGLALHLQEAWLGRLHTLAHIQPRGATRFLIKKDFPCQIAFFTPPWLLCTPKARVVILKPFGSGMPGGSLREDLV